MIKLRQDTFLLWEWLKIHRQVGGHANLREFFRLRKAYASEGRYYHTFQHIAECIRFVNRHYGEGKDIALVKFALFYHDVEYDVTKKDNEEQSAQQWEFYARVSGLRAVMKSTLVADMIRMTAKHKVEGEAPLCFKMMSDADMHIFLCPDSHYVEYARNIWREYSCFGRDLYLKGRLQFLDTVDPTTVFYTHQARKLVHIAVANLDLEKTILRDSPDVILVQS